VRRAALGLIAGAVAGGCAKSTADQGVPPVVGTVCKPDVTIFCRCPNGEPGWKTCSPDGMSFDRCSPCDELPPDDGGGGAGGEDVAPLPEECGNRVVEGSEQCDDGNLVETDECRNDCRLATCGDGQVYTGVEECDDGNTTPGDGCSGACRLEPQAGDTCPGVAVSLSPCVDPTLGGDTSALKPDFAGSCGGAQGKDQVFLVVPSEVGQVTATVTSTGALDPVLYVLAGVCPGGGELGCADATHGPGAEVVTFKASKGGKFFVIVDSAGGAGGYALTLHLAPEAGSCTTGKPGVCAQGELGCQGAQLVCKQKVAQGPEVCGDKLDNDCDTVVDNGCGCAHPKCDKGEKLAASCDPCVGTICKDDPFCCGTTWDSKCVTEVRTKCGILACAEAAGSCAHGPCAEGVKLASGCDAPPATTSCVKQICDKDPYCCNTTWDDLCVDKVATVCGSKCG
jgi:cysteine-rich repeat protein